MESASKKEIRNRTDRTESKNTFSGSRGSDVKPACRRTNPAVCSNSRYAEQATEAGNSARQIQSEGSLSSLENAGLHDPNESCKAYNTTGVQENSRQQNGGSLHDVFFTEYFDDDVDDSDWEPTSRTIMQKWICTNCTMTNFAVDCCNVCGEPKESDIIGCDLFQLFIGKETPLVSGSDTDSSSKASTCTCIGFDERMLLHSEVELEMKLHPHPERPDRLRAIASSFANAGIFPGKCSFIPAREITRGELQKVHSLDLIETVHQTSHMLCSYFTSDTFANKHSALAARLAAGLSADLARAIIDGQTRNGFALVRPPGHHAGIKQAMGFCLHNNAAVAALAAQSAGAKKVLIVDWDVHHGNGTQEIFDGNKSVLYISLHRHEGGRFYPGTGSIGEVGIADAQGYSVNIPWGCGGVGDNDYIFAFKHIVLPIATKFAPDITIISAGFDAARGDPLGGCDVTPTGYAQMTHMLTTLAEGKLLVILEGGYNLRSISSSATAVIKVLLGENVPYEIKDTIPSREGFQAVLQVLKVQLQYWPVLKDNFESLQLHWGTVYSQIKRKREKKRRFLGPMWWRWPVKNFVYGGFYRRRGKRLKRPSTDCTSNFL